MSYETLAYDDSEDGVGVVTLNRPHRANAMDKTMLRELDDLCGKLAGDQRLRCVIVTGAGAAFSSGFDLKDQADATPQGNAQWTAVLEADFKGIMSFWNLPMPTIAAVNGPALAGGFELMLACDLAIAAEGAVFGEPELKFGAGIVAMVLPWFVGPKVAKGVIFAGEDRIEAAEAQRLGLVNRVVPAAAVMTAAMDMARKLARMDPMVLQRTKLAINRTYEIMGMQSALRAALDIDIMIESEGSPLKRDFLDLLRRKGMSEALAWRDARLARPSVG
jgi:enoyl-CoA hydratase